MSRKLATNNTGLVPAIAGGVFSVFCQTGQLGAGACATGRTIPRFTWAKDEATAIRLIVIGKKFDMIDNATVFTDDPRIIEPFTYSPSLFI